MRIFTSLLISLALVSCSTDLEGMVDDRNDDEITNEDDDGNVDDNGVVGEVSFETAVNDSDFDAIEKEYEISVFTTSNGDELQIDINSATANISETNLSQELSLVRSDFYLRELEDDLIAFHTWKSDLTGIGSYSKNLNTGEVTINSNYCLLPTNENRAVSLYTGNTDKLVFIHSTFDIPFTSEQYFVTLYDRNSGECNELALDPNPSSQQISLGIQFQIISDTILALLYVTGADLKPVVTLVNLNDLQILGSKTFNRFTYGAFLENSFLAIRMDSGFVFEEYSLEDFSLMAMSSKNNLPELTYGLYNNEIVLDQLPFTRFFNEAQDYQFQPAIYDLSRDEVIEGNAPFLEPLSENLMTTLGTQPVFPVYKVDVENRNIILGYDRNDGTNTGGVLFTNFDGDIYKVLELNYIPEELVIQSVN
ncbi:MAG: hypothetical protein AAGH81_16060 [Bacteroidota bacterium]